MNALDVGLDERMTHRLNTQLRYQDQRLDKYLKRLFSNLSQSFIEKNLRKKNILINGLSVKSKYLVNENDLIIIKNYVETILSGQILPTI